MPRRLPREGGATKLPSSSKLLLRITAAGSLLALAMIPLSWIPPDRLPAALLVLMPGRYLNFAAMTFVALIFGLLASRRELWSSFALLFLTCGLLAGRPQHVVGVPRTPSRYSLSESRQAAPYRLDGNGRTTRRRRMEEPRAEAASHRTHRTRCTHCTRRTYRTCSCSPSSC